MLVTSGQEEYGRGRDEEKLIDEYEVIIGEKSEVLL
jgi:hypothetical protein